MTIEKAIRPRHPLLVLVWTFGLYLLVFTTQYVYFQLGSLATGEPFGALASGEVRTPVTILLRGITGMVLGVPALLLAVRFLWRRSWDWVRLRPSRRHLILGIATGAALASAVVGLLAVTGVARITAGPSRFPSSELVALLVGHGAWALFIAILEETVFRGMFTRELALRWGWTAATAAGGVYFAAMHLIAIVPVLTIWLAAGVLAAGIAASALFTALYVVSGSLWLPIGFHAGWNFALSAVLGATMSGTEQGFGLFRVEFSGGTVLTGGAFGVEMSAVAVTAMIITAAFFLFLRRRGAGWLPSNRTRGPHERKDIS